MFAYGKTKKTPLTTLVFDRFLFSLENHTARFQPSLAIIVQQNVDYYFITSLHVASVSHFVAESYLKTLQCAFNIAIDYDKINWHPCARCVIGATDRAFSRKWQTVFSVTFRVKFLVNSSSISISIEPIQQLIGVF
jgi:hypothetical protein